MAHAWGAPRLRAETVEDRHAIVQVQAATRGAALGQLDEWRLVRISGTITKVERFGDRWRAEVALAGSKGRPSSHPRSGRGRHPDRRACRGAAVTGHRDRQAALSDGDRSTIRRAAAIRGGSGTTSAPAGSPWLRRQGIASNGAAVARRAAGRDNRGRRRDARYGPRSTPRSPRSAGSGRRAGRGRRDRRRRSRRRQRHGPSRLPRRRRRAPAVPSNRRRDRGDRPRGTARWRHRRDRRRGRRCRPRRRPRASRTGRRHGRVTRRRLGAALRTTPDGSRWPHRWTEKRGGWGWGLALVPAPISAPEGAPARRPPPPPPPRRPPPPHGPEG